MKFTHITIGIIVVLLILLIVFTLLQIMTAFLPLLVAILAFLIMKPKLGWRAALPVSATIFIWLEGHFWIGLIAGVLLYIVLYIFIQRKQRETIKK